jgi:phosphoribosylformylglycinamidine synthase
MAGKRPIPNGFGEDSPDLPEIFFTSIRILPHSTNSSGVPGGIPVSMKAKLVITPKKAVLDPQGKTVANALEHMGYAGVTGVRVGKYIEIDLAPGTSAAAADKALNEAALRFLSNPVIEDYRLEIVE